jgi:transcriptional regulator with XRE-family HTH domain
LDVKDDFPATFRARRIALGLTQDRAAAAAGVGRGTLIAFENGEARITLANLRRLMAVVGLELAAREASARPTLDELPHAYASEQPAPRKRASRKRRHST